MISSKRKSGSAAAHARPPGTERRRRSKDHPLLFEPRDLVRVQPDQLAEHLFVVLAERGPRRAQLARRAFQPIAQALIWRRAHDLVIEPVPEAEGFEIFVAMKVDAVLHGVSCDARGLQCQG